MSSRPVKPRAPVRPTLYCLVGVVPYWRLNVFMNELRRVEADDGMVEYDRANVSPGATVGAGPVDGEGEVGALPNPTVA